MLGINSLIYTEPYVAPLAEFCALIMHLLSSSASEKQAGTSANPVFRIDTVAIDTAGSHVAAAGTQLKCSSLHQLKCSQHYVLTKLQRLFLQYPRTTGNSTQVHPSIQMLKTKSYWLLFLFPQTSSKCSEMFDGGLAIWRLDGVKSHIHTSWYLTFWLLELKVLQFISQGKVPKLKSLHDF